MLRQSILLFVLFTGIVNANATTEKDSSSLETYKVELEQKLFKADTSNQIVAINTIELYEVDEEVTLHIDTKQYLPDNFVAKKGMFDLDWSTIELIEIEEDIDLGINPKEYLPANFNPYKGLSCKSTLVSASFKW